MTDTAPTSGWYVAVASDDVHVHQPKASKATPKVCCNGGARVTSLDFVTFDTVRCNSVIFVDARARHLHTVGNPLLQRITTAAGAVEHGRLVPGQELCWGHGVTTRAAEVTAGVPCTVQVCACGAAAATSCIAYNMGDGDLAETRHPDAHASEVLHAGC